MTRAALVPTLLLCAAVPAAAQGNGHGNAYGHYNGPVTAPVHGAPSASVSGTGVRNFGSWLDDATVQDPGNGFVTFGFGFYKTPVFREIDFPSLDSGFGVTKTLQLGMSLPYAHASVPGAATSHGLGDVYLNAKYQLRAPSTAHTGLAVIPMLEVLSVAPPAGGSRLQWALPVSLERQFDHWRAMGTGGYFSRGAVFGAGAIEAELSNRAWLTGSLGWSYSTRHDDLSTALGYHRGRVDAGGGVTYAVGSRMAVYGSVGRTLSAHDANSASFIFTTGVSFGLEHPIH